MFGFVLTNKQCLPLRRTPLKLFQPAVLRILRWKTKVVLMPLLMMIRMILQEFRSKRLNPMMKARYDCFCFFSVWVVLAYLFLTPLQIDAEYLRIVEEVTGEPSFALARVKDKYAPVAPLGIATGSQPVLSARGMIASSKPLFSLAVGPAKHQVKV